MSRATDDSFDFLHALMATSMTEELKRGLERARKDPSEDGYEPLSPKLLGVIRAFLKDNGIDSPASAKRFDGLVDQLKNLDLDDVASERPN